MQISNALHCFLICRDLLQTLTDEELYTLECNLCISQDFDFPARAGPEVPSVIIPNLIAALPSENFSDKTEPSEAELACSMQYDEQELEQLNRMVHRAGNEMSSLLSPPSACKSEACRPSMTNVSNRNASPNRVLLNNPSNEEESVFFIDDLDEAAEGLVGTHSSRDTVCDSCPISKQSAPHTGHPVYESGYQREQCLLLKDTVECDISNNNNIEDSKQVADTSLQNSCSCFEGPDSHLYLSVWDVYAHDVEAAEMIAHRTGGMKLSATVIFNPKSPSCSESPTSKVTKNCTLADSHYLANEDGELHQLSLATTNCLVNSCVCCGSCDNSREEHIGLTTNGFPEKIIHSSSGLLKVKQNNNLDKMECTVSAQEILQTEPYVSLAERDSSRDEPALPSSSKCPAHTSGSHVEAKKGLKVNKETSGQQKKCEKENHRNEKASEISQEKIERITEEDRKCSSNSQ